MSDDVQISPLSALLNKTLYKRQVQAVLRLALLGVGGLTIAQIAKAGFDTHKEFKAREAEVEQIQGRIDGKLTKFQTNGFDNADEASAVAKFGYDTGRPVTEYFTFGTPPVGEISEGGKTVFAIQNPIDPVKAKTSVDDAAKYAKRYGGYDVVALRNLDKALSAPPKPEMPYRSAIPHGPQYTLPRAHTP